MNSGERVVSGTGELPDRMRLYEMAKDLGLANKDLVAKVRSLGIDVKNHMSNIEGEDILRVRRALDKERQTSRVEKRLSSTVIRRRPKEGAVAPEVEDRTPIATRSAPVPERAEPRVVANTEVELAPRATFTAAESQELADELAETAEAAPTRASDAIAATAAPAVQETPAAPREVKFGPTGRVIDLTPRIEITQREGRGGAQPARPGLPNRREVTMGRDRNAGGPGARNMSPSKKKLPIGKKQNQTQITTPAAHKRVIKMDETIAVGELAKQMGIKATDVLKKLWSMGMTGVMLNHSIDQDTAGLLATEFGFEVESTAFQEATVFQATEDRPEERLPRAPVVTVMGHVDHGKTSLLDAIRNAKVASGEAGGITQHIGAYKVRTEGGQEIVFLDTPGHEAFTAMRARGAKTTDIVILVVAADDGVMPTTIEAINHAREAKVSILVAINKIDKPGAQPDRIRQQLSEHGLISEQWGGDTIFVEVSAKQKLGIEQLLQMILLQAEVLELRANPAKLARGTVVEAKLDRSRGPMVTALVQEGTLRTGDTIVAGEAIGKVRAMIDDRGQNVTEAGPSTPVELLGLSVVPEAGDAMYAVADEKQAKELVDHRRAQRRQRELGGSSRVSLENILEKIKEGAVKELKVVLKADVQGSIEALRSSLSQLSTEQVRVDVISTGVGGITETDINLAKAGHAIVVGFHVRPAGKAQQLAEQEGVDIRLYDVIYEALDDVKKAMAGLLAPVRREKSLGRAEVRETFAIPKIGVVCGSFVTGGLMRRNALVRLIRDSVQVYQGKLASLRRFKEDVREVKEGYECGLVLENYNDVKIGDVVEAYEVEEVAATLE